MTATTRHRDDEIGTQLRLEGGVLQQRRSVGAPGGTVITVENLFFNTPARLKFMKKETTEKRHIAGIVSRYAMAYPHVRLILEQDGREVFRTNGGGSLADVIVGAMGLDTIKNMLEVDDTQGDIHVYGFTSAPRMNRADRSRITLFVNGRWIQDTSLTYAVIASLSHAADDRALSGCRADDRAAAGRHGRERPPDQSRSPVPRGGQRVFGGAARGAPRRDRSGADALTPQPALRRRRERLAAASPDGHGTCARQSRSARAPASRRVGRSNRDPGGRGAPTMPRTLPLLRVVGQIGAAYIVAEGPAGLYLIDQHAAHERILYEQFMAEYMRQDTIAQYALAAQTVQVAPDEARLIEEKLPLLGELGFDLEPFGPNVFVIRSIPAMLADSDPVEVIAGIVDDLAQGNKPGMASVEEKIVLRVCKSAAVKAGQILSFEQMQGIIRQLERCQSPLTCPHGRPTMIHMSTEQLEHEFGRI